MAQIVPEPYDVRHRKNPAERAYLLRVIARTVTESLPAPMIIETDPSIGYVNLRFDDNAAAAVDAWAVMLGVDTVHHELDIELLRDRAGRGWHWVGNSDAGTLWHGWQLHIWCKVTGPAADSPPADPAHPATWPAPGQTGREDEVAFTRSGGER
ncbi:hypothetical protein KIF24_02035 [Micromonospora sp. Llam7]|uniref:hypothetical protein n=1 Tax=Micromonospora tarapacensis TaxID=2835305 RepID=UPI001C82AC91|nr:hypothetical protein [Micromonospora tarapacensis]MBX7264954.1 hypothetical protein [Micromonospora tarapacensis]